MCASTVKWKSQACANSSGGQLQASHHGDPGSILGYSVSDLCWTKWLCDSVLFCQQYAVLTNRTKLLYFQNRESFWKSEGMARKKNIHTLFFSASPWYSIYLPAQIAAGIRGRLQGKWRSSSWCCAYCVVMRCVCVWTRRERAIYITQRKNGFFLCYIS